MYFTRCVSFPFGRLWCAIHLRCRRRRLSPDIDRAYRRHQPAVMRQTRTSSGFLSEIAAPRRDARETATARPRDATYSIVFALADASRPAENPAGEGHIS